MADLYTAMAILALISQCVLMTTVKLTRDITKREATAVGFVVSLLVLCYIIFIWKSSILADYLQVSSLVVLINWFPMAAAFLAGITWTHGYGSKARRIVFGGVLFATSCWSVFAPVRGEPPECENLWDLDGVCRQSSLYTCTPAAAAMLLRLNNVPADESEMADLCLTRRGTTWLGLFRGLILKTQGLPVRVRVVECTWDELTDKINGPAILSVGIDPSQTYNPAYVEDWGWHPGVRHSVLLRDIDQNGNVLVADPAVGLEWWAPRDLETLFRGRFVSIEQGVR